VQGNCGARYANSSIRGLTSGLDVLEERLREPEPTLAEVTETIWALRQQLTGGLSETIIQPPIRANSIDSTPAVPRVSTS
jgi:hypothetical protein